MRKGARSLKNINTTRFINFNNTRKWKGLGIKRKNGKCITIKEGIYETRDSSKSNNGSKTKELG